MHRCSTLQQVLYLALIDMTHRRFKFLVETLYMEYVNFLLQIENLEQEIQAKRKQMSILEQRIIESGESSVANSSLVEMKQVAILILKFFGILIYWKVVFV